jgi:hypothetical protein
MIIDIELIKAFNEGKTIQCKESYTEGPWYDCNGRDGISFWKSMDYRVKPEPIIRYFEVIDTQITPSTLFAANNMKGQFIEATFENGKIGSLEIL